MEDIQAKRDKLRMEVHSIKSDESWTAIRAVRNKIIVVTFLTNALSSKRPNEAWKLIRLTLFPNPHELTRIDSTNTLTPDTHIIRPS